MAIDYLVGIDFGAGETSASYYDVCGEQSPDKTTRLHHLSIVPTGDVSKIYSAIKQVNGEWRLVTDPTDFMCTDLRVNFKRRPSVMDSVQRDSNFKFFRMVFKSILESNRTFLSFNDVTGEKNFLLLVARPTSWSEEDEDEYLALMKEAGLPVDLVVKESEAALAKWSQKALQGNTLVVDCGSSTIDLTLVKNGKLYDWSLYTCIPPQGAKSVEELLKKYLEHDEQYVKDCSDVQRELLKRKINLNLDEAIKLFLRNIKERFYTNTPEAIELSLKKRPFIDEKGDVIDVVLTRNELENIVSPYFDELREFFKNVKDTLLNSGIVVEKLILSGGASRMPLVKQILSEVFAINGDDNKVFFHDKASSDYVVSDGLALYCKDAFNQEDCFDTLHIGYTNRYLSDDSLFLSLEFKNSVHAPFLRLRFYDFQKNFVLEKNVHIGWDESPGKLIEIGKLNIYMPYMVHVDSLFKELAVFELFPRVICIRVDDLCFIMTYLARYRQFRTFCCYPLWWKLMPDSTMNREIINTNTLLTLEKGEHATLAKTFIERLCTKTGLHFSLLPNYNNFGGRVGFFLDLAQYKDALANGNSCLFIPEEDCRNWKSIKMDGNVLPSVSKFDELWCILDGNGRRQSSNSSI